MKIQNNELIRNLTCENCFVRLEFSTTNSERYVTKFLVFEELTEIIRQPALRYFKLYHITLTGDVDTVRHYADLKAMNGKGVVRDTVRWTLHGKIE